MADYEEFDPEDEGYERESPEVYRHRRIIAALIALLVVILLIWGGVALIQKVAGGSDAGSAQESTPAAGDNFESFSARPDPSGSASAEGSASPSGGASSSPSASESAQPSDSPSDGESSASSAPTAQPSQPAASPSASTQQPVQACSDGLQVTASVDKDSYAQGQNPVMTATATNDSGNPCTVDLGSANVTYKITSGPADVFDSARCGDEKGQDEATLQPGAQQTSHHTWDRTMNVYGCGGAAQPAQPGYYWVTATVNGVASEPTAIVIR